MTSTKEGSKQGTSKKAASVRRKRKRVMRGCWLYSATLLIIILFPTGVELHVL